MHLGHRLEIQPAVLARLEGEVVLAQGLLVVPLLPEREPEVEVRECRAGDGLRADGAPGDGAGLLGGRRGGGCSTTRSTGSGEDCGRRCSAVASPIQPDERSRMSAPSSARAVNAGDHPGGG